MEIELRFFANFREAVGGKTLEREFDDGATVGDALDAVNQEFPDLDLFEDGELRSFVNVMRNGRNVIHLDGLDTEIDDGDQVSVFPPVSGGTREVTHTASGPYRIDEEDVDPEKGDIAICMCGLSAGYPLCDGSHRATEDEEPGVRYKYEGDDDANSRHRIERIVFAGEKA